MYSEMLAGAAVPVTLATFRFWRWNLASGKCDGPSCELIWIARTFVPVVIRDVVLSGLRISTLQRTRKRPFRPRKPTFVRFGTFSDLSQNTSVGLLLSCHRRDAKAKLWKFKLVYYLNAWGRPISMFSS